MHSGDYIHYYTSHYQRVELCVKKHVFPSLVSQTPKHLTGTYEQLSTLPSVCFPLPRLLTRQRYIWYRWINSPSHIELVTFACCRDFPAGAFAGWEHLALAQASVRETSRTKRRSTEGSNLWFTQHWTNQKQADQWWPLQHHRFSDIHVHLSYITDFLIILNTLLASRLSSKRYKANLFSLNLQLQLYLWCECCQVVF